MDVDKQMNTALEAMRAHKATHGCALDEASEGSASQA